MDINSKTYVNLAERRSVGFDRIEAALEVVREFIITKQRIIYGGMAIDLALKLAGHAGIYHDDVIPDYDFMSPDFYNESNELARKLHGLGMPNVSSINAFHFNSRRVRVNFKSVADISYIPPNIYKIVPTIQINSNRSGLKKYNGMLIVHPDFQRMDLHRAFTTPYANPPLEVIMHRLEKDQKRFQLLDERYGIKLDMKLVPKHELRISLTNVMIGGVAAYAIMTKLLSLLTPFKPELGVEFGDEIVIQSPVEGITIMTDDFESVIATIPGDKKYENKWLDNIRPRTIRVAGFEIFDINGELVPCYDLGASAAVVGKLCKQTIRTPPGLHIPGINTVLLYFLQRYFETGDEVWKALYQSCLDLRKTANEFIAKLDSEMLTEDRKHFGKVYEHLPFYLPVATYGRNNWSTDYVMNIKERKYFLLNPEGREVLRPVFGYYPERGPDWPEFDISASPFYAVDGKLTKAFKPIDKSIR